MSGLTLIAITGLPASGKSTLAQELARRLHAPLLTKDSIKEPLLEVLGPGDRAHSRRLSDASFAVLFALAREMLAHLDAGTVAQRSALAQGGGPAPPTRPAQPAVLIVEGNFRPGEHEAPFERLLSQGVRLVQIECRVEESVRAERLRQRASDPARHSGHADAELVIAAANAVAGFLALPGKRVGFDSGASEPNLARLERDLREHCDAER